MELGHWSLLNFVVVIRCIHGNIRFLFEVLAVWPVLFSSHVDQSHVLLLLLLFLGSQLGLLLLQVLKVHLVNDFLNISKVLLEVVISVELVSVRLRRVNDLAEPVDVRLLLVGCG